MPDASGSGTSGIASTRGGFDASHLSGGHGVPTASPPANRRLSGRILDAWPARPSSGRGAATRAATAATPAAPVGPVRRDTTTDAHDPTRAGVPAAPPSRRGSPPGIAEHFGPSRDTFGPRITTAPTADGATVGGAGSGLWPALPAERAQQDRVRATQRAEPNRSQREQREPTVAHLSVGTVWPASTAVDPWPELPDDTPLWTAPGAALDAGHVDRLDREQAGG